MNDSSEFGVRSSECNVKGKLPAASSGLVIRHSALRTPQSSGFTLLEVLIAMAIMAAIVTVIYATFSSTGRNIERAEASRDATDLARTLVTKLSSDIANAYLNPDMNAPAITTIFFGKKVRPDTGNEKGGYDELSLTTLTNWRTPNSKEMDLWEVGYTFRRNPDGTGSSMMRREKRELGKDSPALEGGVEYEMTNQVASLRLRYYNGSTWSDEWDSRTLQRLPNAVEVALVLADGSSYLTQVEVGR